MLRISEREQGQFSVPGGGVRGVGGEQRCVCVWVGGVSIIIMMEPVSKH